MANYDLNAHIVPIEIRHKLDRVERIAKTDPLYLHLERQCVAPEEQFYALEETLTPEQRDMIWDFFGLREAMTRRLLELACLNMELPGP